MHRLLFLPFIALFSMAIIDADAASNQVSRTYVDQVKAMYEQRGNEPEHYIRPLGTIGFVRGLRYNATMRTRAFGSSTEAVAQDKTRARESLANAETKFGADSLQTVAPLVNLVMLSNDDPDAQQRYTERALKTVDPAALNDAKNTELPNAVQSLLMLNRDGFKGIDDSSTERLLKLLFKLYFEAEGFSNQTMSILDQLCQSLAGEGKRDEAIDLYKVTLDHVDKDYMRLQARRSYIGFLRNLGGARTDLAEQEIKLKEDQQKSLASSKVQAIEQVGKSRARAEVDPVGLMNADCGAAELCLESGDRQAAKPFSDEAFSVYLRLAPEDVDDRVTETLWNSVNAQLRNAQTKQDEQIAYAFFDATEEKCGSKSRGDRSHLNEITEHFTSLHRNLDAIAFLEHALNKRRERKSPADSTAYITDRLLRLYDETGHPEKESALRSQLIASAEDASNQSGPEASAAMLKAASLMYDSKDYVKANILISQWQTQIRTGKSHPTKEDLAMLDQVIVRCISLNDLRRADELLRTGYEIASKRPLSTYIGAISGAVDTLVNKYKETDQLQQAEELLKFILKNSDQRDPRFQNDRVLSSLSDLHLEQAAAALRAGKTHLSEEYKAESDAEFAQFTAPITSTQNLQMIKTRHDATLRRLKLN